MRLPLLRPLPALAVVFVTLAVLVTPVLQPWLAQRHRIAAQQAQVQDLTRKQAALEAERKRWNDPEYVKAQARQRLHYVMPGEIGLNLLTDPKTRTAIDPRDRAAQMAGQVAQQKSDVQRTQTWYSTIWESTEIASGAP